MKNVGASERSGLRDALEVAGADEAAERVDEVDGEAAVLDEHAGVDVAGVGASVKLAEPIRGRWPSTTTHLACIAADPVEGVCAQHLKSVAESVFFGFMLMDRIWILNTCFPNPLT